MGHKTLILLYTLVQFGYVGVFQIGQANKHTCSSPVITSAEATKMQLDIGHLREHPFSIGRHRLAFSKHGPGVLTMVLKSSSAVQNTVELLINDAWKKCDLETLALNATRKKYDPRLLYKIPGLVKK